MSQNNNGWGQPQSNDGWGQPQSSNGWGQQNTGQPNSSNNSWGSADQGFCLPKSSQVQGTASNPYGSTDAYSAAYNPSPSTGWGEQAQNSTGWGQVPSHSAPVFSTGYNNTAVTNTSVNVNQPSIKKYRIVSGLADLVLGFDANYRIVLYRKNLGDDYNQVFTLEEKQGNVVIRCVANNYVLVVPNKSQANEVGLFLEPDKNECYSKFQRCNSKQNSDEFYLKTFCGKCADVSQQKTVVGTPIIQYAYNGGRNQIWYLEQA